MARRVIEQGWTLSGSGAIEGAAARVFGIAAHDRSARVGLRDRSRRNQSKECRLAGLFALKVMRDTRDHGVIRKECVAIGDLVLNLRHTRRPVPVERPWTVH